MKFSALKRPARKTLAILLACGVFMVGGSASAMAASERVTNSSSSTRSIQTYDGSTVTATLASGSTTSVTDLDAVRVVKDRSWDSLGDYRIRATVTYGGQTWYKYEYDGHMHLDGLFPDGSSYTIVAWRI